MIGINDLLMATSLQAAQARLLPQKYVKSLR
jgi:hypothetical protein